MSITGALKGAGYVPEKSTVGDRLILEGVYKAMLVEYKYGRWENKSWVDMPFGEEHDDAQINASFKVIDGGRLVGTEPRGAFPEFRSGFNTAPAKCNSNRRGLAKLLNGFHSVGINVDSSSDEAFQASLDSLKGTAIVFIKAFEDFPNVEQADGSWKKDKEGDRLQGWSFMTEKNALKEVAKIQKKQGHPL